MQDIFGERQSHGDCLYSCESAEEYDQKVANLKEKWNEIEREHTRNNPPNKFVSYFVGHKEKQIREKMIKAVRRKANIDGDYGQNPIEWLNFLSKQEIDEFGKTEGHSHRDISLTNALTALKNRYLRLYDNAVKAIYDEGPYIFHLLTVTLSCLTTNGSIYPRTKSRSTIKALMSYVPTPAALPRSDVTTTEEEIMVSDLPDNDAIIRASQQTTASNVPRRLIPTAQEANIQAEAVPPANLQDIFKRAEFLLNEPGALMRLLQTKNA